MAIMLAAEADLAPDPHTPDQPADAAAQDMRPVERFLDESRLAKRGSDLAHHGPFRPLDAACAVPFRIFGNHHPALVGRDGAGAAELGVFSLSLGSGFLGLA